MFLDELGLPPDVLAQIKKMLATSQDGLSQSKPVDLDSSVFGDSWSGGALGGNTSIAHKHVVQAIQDMVTGLSGYQENVERFETGVRRADEDSHTDFTRIEADVNCTSTPDLHTNESCTG
jgi:hypothetical protein